MDPRYYNPASQKLFWKLPKRFPKTRTFLEHWLRGFIGLMLIGGIAGVGLVFSAVVVVVAYFTIDQLLPSDLMLDGQYRPFLFFVLSIFLVPYLYSTNFERIGKALKDWTDKRDRRKFRRPTSSD